MMRVSRARRGSVWHWPHPTRRDVSACTATPLDPTRRLDPVSVDMRDRCTGHGCRQQWHVWLAATVRAALADTVERWHAELTTGTTRGNAA